MRCYVARPKQAAAKIPAVVVIHENRGLNAHIEDVARRAALHVYPGTDHAFHNDTAGARYNQQAAELAWKRTMAFLKDALR
ncbi:MAG TPA: dienelactone hydrolase family protein [Burkholderiales bacterium]